MRVELHLEARAELRAAAVWYDERRPGLGDEFIAEVSSMFDRIGDVPASFPVWPGTAAAPLSIRRAVINRFPYVIAFEVHSDHTLVLAIHTRKAAPTVLAHSCFLNTPPNKKLHPTALRAAGEFQAVEPAESMPLLQAQA